MTTINLYTIGTPNGRRPTILLELLGLEYNFHKIDIFKGEQFTDSYQKINPYKKIPALKDINPSTGDEIAIFESGAILEFISSKYDTEFKFHYDNKHPLYWDQQKWFYFTNSSLSPSQGIFTFYYKFATEKVDFAINKSKNDILRVYSTLEQRLIENNGWFVGDHINIVDISAYTFVRRSDFIDFDLKRDYPHLWTWLQKLNKVDAFEKGYNIPTFVIDQAKKNDNFSK